MNGERAGSQRAIDGSAGHGAPLRRRFGHFDNIVEEVLLQFGTHTSSDRGVNGFVVWDQTRTVWFYRDYVRLYGGHVKHSHYFDHVRRMPDFAAKITFSGEPSSDSQARERQRLWPAGDGIMARRWEPADRDVLFLAGVDWRYLFGSGLEALANPRINLVQHVRHAHENTEPPSLPLREGDPDLREPGGGGCNLRHRADERPGSDDPERYRCGVFPLARGRFTGWV